MATIKFFIQSKKNPAGIYVRVREGRGIDAKAKTNFVINPDNWSKAKGQPKNLADEIAKKLHKDLTDLSTNLLTHYNSSVKIDTIDTQWLKDFIKPPAEVGAITNKLVDYYDYYSLHKKSSLGYTTFKKLNVQKRLLERFEEETKAEYLIKDVNADFKLKFEKYCSKENYAPNTIAQVFKSIKTICYHARNNGIDTHFQLNGITVKGKKVDKIYLSFEELKLIEGKAMDNESLDNAKDWLLISCETGQRVSDFMRFKTEMIRYEKNKKGELKPLIEFTQVKTGKKMSVPLSKKVMAILKKRNGEFPYPISDQKYNDYIKKVCEKAEISQIIKGSKAKTEKDIKDKEKTITRKETGLFPKHELVTSHIGRRSFSTNNYGRIPTSLLINVTGHATESQFLEYIGKSETEKAIQLHEYIK